MMCVLRWETAVSKKDVGLEQYNFSEVLETLFQDQLRATIQNRAARVNAIVASFKDFLATQVVVL